MFLIFSSVIFAIGAVMMGIYLDSIIAIIIACVFAALEVGVAIHTTISDKNKRFCSKCKRQYDFEEDISYEQTDHKVKSFSLNHNRETMKQLRTREFFGVAVTCTCPQCGSTKQFKTSLEGRSTYYDGSIHDNDPEQEIEKFFKKGSSRGAFRLGLIFLGVGLVLIWAAIGLFATREPVANEDSSGDPEDYYGIYYATDQNGGFYELELNSDREFELTVKDISGRVADSATGEYYYKDKDDAADLISGADKELLLLETAPDLYIKVWIIRSNQGITLEISDIGITLTTKEVTPETVTKDPKNYYGVYYGIDETYLVRYVVTIDETEVIMYAEDLTDSETYRFSYQYVSGDFLSTILDNPKYTDKNALLCRIDKNDMVVVIWFLSEGTNVKLELGGIDVVLTTENVKLSDYIDNWSAYAYNSNTYLE